MMPSEVIQEFLNHIEEYQTEYKLAFENVGREDKRLQDLLHELELAKNAKERNRVATKFQKSRKLRRENKDKVQLLENMILFFQEPQNRKVLNQLTQLLGKQRKVENVLTSERIYKPRMEAEAQNVTSIEGEQKCNVI